MRDGDTAIAEMAAASGLALLHGRLDVRRATTTETGELIVRWTEVRPGSCLASTAARRRCRRGALAALERALLSIRGRRFAHKRGIRRRRGLSRRLS